MLTPHDCLIIALGQTGPLLRSVLFVLFLFPISSVPAQESSHFFLINIFYFLLWFCGPLLATFPEASSSFCLDFLWMMSRFPVSKARNSLDSGPQILSQHKEKPSEPPQCSPWPLCYTCLYRTVFSGWKAMISLTSQTWHRYSGSCPFVGVMGNEIKIFVYFGATILLQKRYFHNR